MCLIISNIAIKNSSWKDTKELVNTTVYVDGQEVNYNALELVQHYGQHDRFRVHVDYDVFEKKFMDNPLQDIKKLGWRLSIEFTHGNSEENKYRFTGIIIDAETAAREGRHTELRLNILTPN